MPFVAMPRWLIFISTNVSTSEAILDKSRRPQNTDRLFIAGRSSLAAIFVDSIDPSLVPFSAEQVGEQAFLKQFQSAATWRSPLSVDAISRSAENHV